VWAGYKSISSCKQRVNWDITYTAVAAAAVGAGAGGAGEGELIGVLIEY